MSIGDTFTNQAQAPPQAASLLRVLLLNPTAVALLRIKLCKKSIARLQASLAQATNEVTVAAANINFDFCLVKYDAPKEYQPIGELLSTKRKQDAEQGTSHVTARRMAALFEGTCPDTPCLIRAYGQRVSEISKKATDQESQSCAASMFGQYIGVDATSIWAAATSSRSTTSGAIHVHLLACLLALMFDAAEATSIWAELIEERRKAIATSWERDEEIPFSTAAAAAQQGISRRQLAEWDASARAWLQTADSIMVSKQTQLRLILKNVNLSMGSETKVYPSVVSAWKKTLSTMERLVEGIPQEVQDGTAILGLAAWHIYPDISVYGQRNVEVRMGDPLVPPGGILSLGCNPSATTPSSGVSWSLSLSQLKYYGDPVRRVGSFKPDPTRITFDQLLLATIGCILSHWNVSTSRNSTTEALKIMSMLSNNFLRKFAINTGNRQQLPKNFEERVEGLRLLSKAAQTCLDDEESSLPFVNLGRNRPSFIPRQTKVADGVSKKSLPPFLSLCDVDVLIKCMQDVDGQIQLLRRIASRATDLDGAPCVIQYADQIHRDDDVFNYATVFPTEVESPGQGPTRRAGSHSRWVQPKFMDGDRSGERLYANENYSIYAASPPLGNYCAYKPKQHDALVMTRWCGPWDVAAIYIAAEPGRMPNPPTITPQDLLWCLEYNLLSPENVLLSPENLLHQTNDSVMQTLEYLAIVYKNGFRTIPEPTIQVRTLTRPLIAADSLKEFASVGRAGRDRLGVPQTCQTVSILSYLIASHDILCSKIPPNVVGVSIGNSIFVPQQLLLNGQDDVESDWMGKLLCDPTAVGNRGSFTRILGNIGKPGFVMFFSVENPKISPPDETFWRNPAPREFDGRAADFFQTTSMHLSFTNWERPIEDFSSRGIQDVQLTLMESVVSIRERGKWIGDVDVVAALKSKLIYQLPPQKPCDHAKFQPPGVDLQSIESWDELREFHAGNNVVRVNGNWLARLATTAYLAQHAQEKQWNVKRITLCPLYVCWKCLQGYVEQFPANIYVY